jgi:thiamine biosynthesis lipoprotein
VTAAFRAMNTDVQITVPEASPRNEQRMADAAERQFGWLEGTFSRFRANSELSRLNTTRGPVVVSAVLFRAIQRAQTYWELTDGWFDITVGRALCDAGYDRGFAPGALDRPARADGQRRASCTSEDVRLDRVTRTVELSPGTTLDCGGFIKGWAVDCATERLPRLSAVDAGGDAVLRGNGPDGRGWRVHVEDPWRLGQAIVGLRVRDRAVATSGSNRRRWYTGGRPAHHLIDPHTAQPAVSDLVQVTVVASSAELADVLAKTVFLRGSGDGKRFMKQFADGAAVLVGVDGDIQIEGELEPEFNFGRKT